MPLSCLYLAHICKWCGEWQMAARPLHWNVMRVVLVLVVMVAAGVRGVHCDHHHDDDTCGHHHDDDTCGHHHDDDTCGHHHDDDTCGHHHHHHENDDDPLKSRWVATYTDDGGTLHEHPVIFRTASGLAYLTPFNIPTATDARFMDRGVLFLYQQGCGLCEEAHVRFAEAVKALAVRWPVSNRSNRILFGQVDVSPSEDADEEAALEAIRQRFGQPQPASNETLRVSLKDYPTIVLLEHVGTAPPALRVHGYSGPLTWYGLSTTIGLTPSSEAQPFLAEEEHESDSPPLVFDGGILVC